MFTIVSMV